MGSVFLFLVSVFLVFASDVSAACGNLTTVQFQCSGGASCSNCASSFSGWLNVNYSVSGVAGANCSEPGASGTVTLHCTSSIQRYFKVESAEYARPCSGNNYGAWGIFTGRVCDGVESSSSSAGGSSSSPSGPPLPPPPHYTWHCQNSGGAVPGGFGAPPTADLYKCETLDSLGQVCTLKRKLHGTCQDWDFCDFGVDDCEIDPEKGDPPCGRSGESFTTSPYCYYACGDGTDLTCKPVSTQYVAGAIYKGECPSDPPEGCRPASSSSGSAESSGSAVSSSSYGTSPPDWRDTVSVSPGGSQPPTIDYTRILAAIHDTLHRANEQREFLMELDNNISLDVDKISNYTEYIYNVESSTGSAVNGINSKLTSLQENGISLVSSTASDLSDSRRLLDEINSYLHSDSAYNRGGDTVYNPLLRDIKGAIDSITVDVTVNGDSSGSAVDSSLLRWFGDYVQDTAAQKGVIGKIWDSIKPGRDSVLSRNCTGFNECLAVHKRIDYCRQQWGVSTADCVDGGSPFDNMLNVEGSILSTLWDAIWGEDSTSLDTVSRLDTNVTFSPQKDTAESWLSRAFSSLFSPESTEAMLQRVERMKDSVERVKNDTVKVQPDSLWLDSSEAAAYVQDMLLPPGTVNECWVCHAELGTFGGLAPNGLSIHVDFGNFGGFDFCAIIRAVVKIAAFVVCMSLTLGSWMAAFGYNPKNDA